jgi:hypothetical protein
MIGVEIRTNAMWESAVEIIAKKGRRLENCMLSVWKVV